MSWQILNKDVKKIILFMSVKIFDIIRLFQYSEIYDLFSETERYLVYKAVAIIKEKNRNREWLYNKKYQSCIWANIIDKKVLRIDLGFMTCLSDMVCLVDKDGDMFRWGFRCRFCPRCDTGFTYRIWDIKDHIMKCNASFTKKLYKCKTLFCLFKTKDIVESEKHRLECSKIIWECTLCGKKDIPSKNKEKNGKYIHLAWECPLTSPVIAKVIGEIPYRRFMYEEAKKKKRSVRLRMVKNYIYDTSKPPIFLASSKLLK